MNDEDVAESYRIVRREMRAYGGGLDKKREIVALSKCDTVTPECASEQAERLKKACRKKPFLLSSATKINVDRTLRRIASVLQGQSDSAGEDAIEASGADAGWSPLSQ